SLLIVRRALLSASFFCQAEDGIRDRNVTGVQTCALPICPSEHTHPVPCLRGDQPIVGVGLGACSQRPRHHVPVGVHTRFVAGERSEERRVGRGGWCGGGGEE